MNIIQAMQAAEQGQHITNEFLLVTDSFLKYMGNGVFYCYKADEQRFTEYRFEVRSFDLAQVLTLTWKVVDNKIKPRK